MDKTKIVLKDLSKIVDISTNTLRVYLDSWVLSRYSCRNGFIICEDSVNRFYTYLTKIKKIKEARKFKNKYTTATYIKDIEDII